jgi:deoxyadenosine/deoxycytidine kinase
MTRQEFELYVDVFRNMSRDVMPPDIFVYLDVAPEECHRRMNSRAREQESGVPLDYLQHLDKNYKLLLQEMRRRGVRVMVIDWKEFGPPVDVWKQILRMAISSDSWYEQLAFSFAKHPRMPVMPNGGEPKTEA